MTAEEFLNEYHFIAAEERDFSHLISNKYMEESLDSILKLRKEFCFTEEELRAFLFDPLQPMQAIENVTKAAQIIADHRLLGIFKITDEATIPAVLEKQKSYLELIKNNFSIGHILKLIENNLDRHFLAYQRLNMLEINRILDTQGLQLLIKFLNEFDDSQKNQIIIGLLNPVVAPHVYLYAHPQFKEYQMSFIREYLSDEGNPLDKVFFLLRPDLTIDQLGVIFAAIKKGLSTELLLEISKFDGNETEKMKQLIDVFKQPIPQSAKKTQEPVNKNTLLFTKKQREQLTAAKADKLSPDVLKYIQNPQFPPELMNVIRSLSKEQVPLEKIKDYLQTHNQPNVWLGLLQLRESTNKSIGSK